MTNGNLLKITTFVTTLLLPVMAQSASVWTLTGIVDSTYGDTWSYHIVSKSDVLISENVTGVYFDNLNDGSVDLNWLVNNPTENFRIAFNGSAEDMAVNYSEFDFPSSILYVGGTLVDAETMTNFSVFADSPNPLYDSAFFSHMTAESFGTTLGTGRLDDDYNAVWSITDLTARRTALSAVPVPAAIWLFGSGLLGLVGFARLKKA